MNKVKIIGHCGECNYFSKFTNKFGKCILHKGCILHCSGCCVDFEPLENKDVSEEEINEENTNII